MRERLLGGSLAVRQVVVALTPVSPGDVVGGHNMAIADIPGKHLSASAVGPDDFHLFEGQVVSVEMSPGEPLLSHFVSGEAVSRFSELLDRGERAVTVQVGELSSNAGMLANGDYIDLFLLTDEPKLTGGAKDEKSLVLLRERVKILSVGNDSLRSREQDFIVPHMHEFDQYATVTIGVPREDAARIALAESLGDLVFMLRSPDDKTMHGEELLSQSLLWRQLAQGQSVQYYTGSTGQGGVLVPMVVSRESSGLSAFRYTQKSVPIGASIEN
ncbi:pilus assembly protein CpaB [Halopseudomonas yangmingensis]|uniref:Pilus assembly protein CpaB n=1 Tax=Halopseudomonas yangmingensis TaxID=1720063 RepID=A0A1I4UM95_9GAMM|nr:pilus assembly protein CpaB [Halopseudomonas yangmingensis]